MPAPGPSPAVPLRQGLALRVPSCLKILLQPLPGHLQLLYLPLGPLSGADKAHLLQQLLLLVDEDQPVPFRVQHSWPGLAVKLGQLDLQVGDPVGGEASVTGVPQGTAGAGSQAVFPRLCTRSRDSLRAISGWDCLHWTSMSSQGTYFYLANTCGASPVPKMNTLCRGGEEMSIRQCPCPEGHEPGRTESWIHHQAIGSYRQLCDLGQVASCL